MKKTKTRLSLEKNTLRALAPSALARAAGGGLLTILCTYECVPDNGVPVVPRVLTQAMGC